MLWDTLTPRQKLNMTTRVNAHKKMKRKKWAQEPKYRTLERLLNKKHGHFDSLPKLLKSGF